MAMPEPHIIRCDDGSLLIEFAFPDYRIGISIEPNLEESSWHVVTREIAQGLYGKVFADQARDLIKALREQPPAAKENR